MKKHLTKNYIVFLAIFSFVTFSFSYIYIEKLTKQTKSLEASVQEFTWFTGTAENTDDKYNPVFTKILFDTLHDLGADRETLHFIPKTDGKYVADAFSVYWVLGKPRKLENVDLQSFVPITTNGNIFSHDKTHFYITGNLVDEIDWRTFSEIKDAGVLSSYVKDEKSVWYITRTSRKSGTEAHLQKIEGADTITFHSLPGMPTNMAADRIHVYTNGKIIPNIDGATFSIIKESMFVTDVHGTYYPSWSEQGLSFIRISPSQDVHIFTNGDNGYSRIGDKIFFGTTTINSARTETFFVFTGEETAANKGENQCTDMYYCPYAGDTDSVYYLGKKIKGVDSKTFSLLNINKLFNDNVRQSSFAKDKNYIYYKDTIVSGADLETFEPINSGSYRYEYGIDKDHVFLETEVISGADPLTFKTFEGQQPYEGCGIGRYAKDALHIYHATTTVEEADYATFMPIIGNGSFAEDAFHFYKGDTPVKKEDFEECGYG